MISSASGRTRSHRRWGQVAIATILAATVATSVVIWKGRRRPGQPRWVVGSAATYELLVDTKISTAPAGTTMVAFTVTGRLALAVVSSSPLLIRFEPRCTMGRPATAGQPPGSSNAPVPPEFAAALKDPFFVEYGTLGAFERLRLSPGTPDFVAQIWRALAATVQFHRPVDARSEWTVEEHDATGRYWAEYHELAPGRYHRRKTRYAKTFAPTVITVDRSDTDFIFDESGDLEDLKSREMVTSAGSGPVPTLSADTRVTFRSLERFDGSRSVDQWRALAQKTQVVRSDAPPGTAAARKEIDDAKTAGLTVPHVLAQLIGLHQDRSGAPLSSEDQGKLARLSVALTTLLRRDPAQIPPVKEHILADGPLAAVLIAALRDAGSAEAQRALVELASRARVGSELRGELVRAFSHLQTPTREAVALLQQFQADPELGIQARFGLGSNAHKLRSRDPALAREIVGDLERQLASARTDGTKHALLTALGNAGSEDVLDTVERSMQEGGYVVRGAAAQALRRVPGDRADRLLITLAGDPEPTVRTSAVDAIAERRPNDGLIELVSRVAMTDDSFSSRARAVRAAAAWAEASPRLIAALETVASKDASDDLRVIARNALSARQPKR